MEEYRLDLTKLYHNLLELRGGNHRQTFYWDINVSAVEDENRIIQYYLLDELGSPLRVLYRNGKISDTDRKLLLYDRNMPYFFVVLSDAEKEQGTVYYCPVPADDADGGKEVIYRIKKPSGSVIKICEELAESLLERGVCGLGLQRD